MKNFLVLATAIMATGCATRSHTSSEALGVISLCDVKLRHLELMDQTVSVRGYVKRIHHGFYASGVDCPDANIWVVLENSRNPQSLKSLMGVAVQPLPDPKEEIVFRARVAMNEYQLPLSFDFSPRLSLEFFDVEDNSQ